MNERHRQRTVAHAGAGDQVVHRQRRRDQPGVPGQRRPTPEGGDSDHAPDAAALERLARRPGEVQIGGLEAVGGGVRRHEPEHGIGAREGPAHDIPVAVRSLHDLDALSRACGGRRDGLRAITRTGSPRSR